MEVVKFAQMLVEDEVVTKLIIRGPHRDHYYATTHDRFYESSEIDLDNLNKIPIDTDTIWPRYSARFLQAPSPVPQDSYVKETNLCFYEPCPEGKEKDPFSDLILHEIVAYELLRRHPHPNIVEYRGCVVEDDRITGICLAKYKTTLCKKIEDSTPLNKDIFLAGIECGIRHLHSLGLVHNDLSPDNVMLDELDRPIIIDFDSWGRDGQRFAPDMKKGALEWSINGSSYEYARFENDIFSLSKLREFLYDPSSGKPLSKSTSANSSQTSTSSTTSSSGPQNVSDVFGTTPETPIEGSGQNTATPPPPKEKEKKYNFWGRGKIKGQIDKQRAGPREQPERHCILM
ncbi:hypothetical protein E4U13_007025 [Claviceps humidiphila]|uniref:EKC/KEOPS complex subunit BUD32 n=1 Tax=Claviceps humidiphila TaxID=1294629 RepID=A0A9P7PVX4_9HYPO|nr:hypothetical protein E4U13_007025 [Claviceps humidiphila]